MQAPALPTLSRMGSRTRRLMSALGLSVALVAGCSAGGDTERSPGDPVTQADADALAELLHRNFTHGGADFVVTAPWG